MKFITLISILGLLIVLTGCSVGDHKKAGYNESRELVPNPEGYQKDTIVLKSNGTILDSNLINIDEGLNQKFGEYFMGFENGTLSLCCFDPLAYPFGSNERSDILSFCKDCKDNTYEIEVNGQMNKRTRFSNSYLDLVVYDYVHEDGFTEYYFEDSSYFKDPTITLNNGLKIGMSKSEIFDKYFWTDSDTIFPNLEMIAVCPDERGELFTQYKFEDDTLHSVVYGFEYY